MRDKDRAEDRESWVSGDFVAGVIDTISEVESALTHLEKTGFERDAIRVYSGPVGSDEIGNIGGSGLKGMLLRAAVDHVGGAKDLTDRHKEEAEKGHHVLIIPVDGEDAADEVHDILREHGGHDVHGRIDGSFLPLAS